MSTPEGRIKAKVDRLLKNYKGLWFFPPQAGPYGAAGIPDRILCANGVFIGVECKRNVAHHLTEQQKYVREKILRANGKYFVVCDDSTLDELRKYLDSILESHDRNDRSRRQKGPGVSG